jgi:hypothetical protein
MHNQSEPTSFPVIGFTHWEHVGGRLMYISDRPQRIRVNGKLIPKPGGLADWEYTEHHSKAIPLSRYWWRRFRHEMHYCGHCAHHTEAIYA